MSEHVCHATGCKRPVPRRMFMCLQHWRMVPKKMQSAIWATYTPGQENHLERVTPEYLDAAMGAVAFVESVERGEV